MTVRTFVIPVTAPSSGTPAWLAGKPLNQWFEIPGTALSSCPRGQPQTYGNGPGAKIDTWNGAALRDLGSIYLIAACGGHGDYAGNEVNALALNTDLPQWVELSPSSAYADQWVSVIYKDLRRAPPHTYNTLQFINQDDRIAMMPYAGVGPDDLHGMPYQTPQWSTLYPRNLMSSYKAVNWTGYHPGNDWDRAELQASGTIPRQGYYANIPSNWSSAGYGMMGCNDRLTGDLYCGSNSSVLWKWTRATNSWSSMPFAITYYGSALCMDQVVRNGEPYRRLLAVQQASIGGEGIYRADTGAFLPGAMNLSTGSQPWSVLGNSAGKYHGAMYDAANDQFWAFLNDVDGNFAQYTIKYVNPTTYTITKLPVTAISGSTVPDFAGTLKAGHRYRNGIHNSIQYVPELKGFVVADQYSDNVHFMRVG